MRAIKYLPTPASLLVSPETPLIHRDLSWIQFNERVLAEARQPNNTLLERAKFLSITASNLDEFFMIRFPALLRSIKNERDPEQRARAKETFRTVCDGVIRFLGKQSEALDLLLGDLSMRGPLASDRDLYEREIRPHVSGLDSSELDRSLATVGNLEHLVILADRTLLRISRTAPPACAVSPGRIRLLDHLVMDHLGSPDNPVVAILRLTRDGDFTLDLEDEDPETIPDLVRTTLRARDEGNVTRIQWVGSPPEDLLEQIQRALGLRREQIFHSPVPLSLHGLRSALAHFLPGLPDPPRSLPEHFENYSSLWDELRREDFLLHHPYDPFSAYVAFVQAAAKDPAVTSIEQTFYRTDALSPIREVLCEAARTKRVRVIIEPRARFDELNNLRLSEDLRSAGVEVSFGIGKLKVHAKIALVTRESNGAVEYFTHLSTGNYNASTAQAYTDLAILTADRALGLDAKHFFDSVCQGHVPGTFRSLVSAPSGLFKKMTQEIEREIAAATEGKEGRIFAKVNALIDPGVIDALYRASGSGVTIDLLVRGACSLIPGVPGLSENIRVFSLIDRYLEHSRIYYFGSSGTLYLSSADWMPRNFFSRLELAFPVRHPKLHKYMTEVVIPTYLADTQNTRELTPQGSWKKRPKRGQRAQERFTALAADHYRGTSLAWRSADKHLTTPGTPEGLTRLVDPELGKDRAVG